jgi:hypothetical protein
MFMPYAPPWGLKLARRVRRLSRAEAAATAGVSVEAIADYEGDRQPLPGEVLFAVISGLAPEERMALSDFIRRFDPPEWSKPNPNDLHPQQMALIDEVSLASGEMIRKYATWRMLKGGDPREIKADIEQEKLKLTDWCHSLFLVREMTLQDKLRRRARRPLPEDRTKGEDLWSRMKPRDMKTRRLFIEATYEFRHWALCGRIGRESLKMVRKEPEAALELAELAVDLARHLQIEQAFRRRLRGFALACRGNARLALGDRPRAEEELTQARRLWESGQGRGTDIFDDAPLRQLAASLKRAAPPAG